MPSVRAFSRAPGAISLVLIRFVRAAIVVAVVAFALALAVVRFIVFPQVESYRDTLAVTLARELGHPVEIAALTTGWDGWNPKLVVDGLRVLDQARAGPLLDLPRVEMIVAWTSLPFLDLRLKELVIERPRLAIRRDRSGILRIAGIEIDPAQVTDDLPLTDWLLRQREIVIHDALITWDDDQRNAPQLVLDRVQFRLESRFGRHRFGLKGTPPAELAAPIDLKGDVKFASTKDWQSAEGELYVRLDYADVAAWREWLPLPGQITSGKGALRIWSRVAHGEPSEIIADLELADVKARLAESLPVLDLAHLSGRVGWRKSVTQQEVFTRALSFTTVGGQQLDPTQLQLTLRDPAGVAAPSGQLEFDRLQLQPLVALSTHLPLPERILADLTRYAPRGTLGHGRMRWEGSVEAPSTYAASAEFTNLGLVAQDALPGATGLTGRFVATHADGELRIASGSATIDLPRVFSAPMVFDKLQSVVKWERHDGKSVVRLEQLEFANADVAGGASGTYRTTAKGPGEIELVAHATRVDLRQLYRYLPRSIETATRHWLQKAAAKGSASDARLKVAGNLADFPFANGKGGQLIATAKATAVTVDYAEGWPPLEAIDADIRIDGARLTLDATRGQALGVDLGKTKAEIADLSAALPLLTIDATAAGPLAGFLRFVNASPLATRVGQATLDLDAAGAARLAFKLSLPLGQTEDTKVAGDFVLTDAQLHFAGAPALSKVNGKLSFSEKDIRAQELAMEVLGGPAKLAIVSADGRTRLTGGGSLNLAVLRREFASAYLDRVSGVMDWALTANLSASSSWVLESTLKGAVVDFPAPLGKTATEVMPFKIERRDDAGQPGNDLILASYGRIARFAAHRSPGNNGATIDRALLSLGKASERPDALRAERAGLWLRADLPVLDIDEWVAALRRGAATDTAKSDQALSVVGAELAVGQLDALGARFANLKLKLRETDHEWAIDLDGDEVAGTATWSMPGTSAPNGRIVARLSRLTVPSRSHSATARDADAKDGASDPKPDATLENPWPAIDIAAGSFVSKEHDLGRLEFVAQPRGADWRIDRLVLANDNGRIEADGAWRSLGRQPQTKLDVVVDVKEAGAFLTRFGYPDALQGARTKINGQLTWSGAPHEFDVRTLAGNFRVEAGPGRFTKIEPGIGKLLGVLSLQALPRRITLDYRDIFSEGFAFDEITGNVRIANGLLTTSNFKLTGPAAKVEIAGDADLAAETQRLAVRVQPALSSTVSAGAALFFLANPLVGAAVGAGSLLAQTVLKDPFEQIFSYEYSVTGGWSDPIVTKNATRKASLAPAAGTPAGTGR